MISLGAVLEDFPDDVITYVTDPRTGIQRRMKWPPTLSEVIEACEERQDHLRKMQEPKRAKARYAEMPGHVVKIFVPEGHPRYSGLVEWAKTEDEKFWHFGNSSDGRRGIWVALAQWESPQRAA